jgi:hypothetical protein
MSNECGKVLAKSKRKPPVRWGAKSGLRSRRGRMVNHLSGKHPPHYAPPSVVEKIPKPDQIRSFHIKMYSPAFKCNM